MNAKNPEKKVNQDSVLPSVLLWHQYLVSPLMGWLCKPATLLKHLSQNLRAMSKVFRKTGRIQVIPVSAVEVYTTHKCFPACPILHYFMFGQTSHLE